MYKLIIVYKVQYNNENKIIFNNAEYDGKDNNYGEIRIIIRIINIMSIKIIVQDLYQIDVKYELFLMIIVSINIELLNIIQSIMQKEKILVMYNLYYMSEEKRIILIIIK